MLRSPLAPARPGLAALTRPTRSPRGPRGTPLTSLTPVALTGLALACLAACGASSSAPDPSPAPSQATAGQGGASQAAGGATSSGGQGGSTQGAGGATTPPTPGPLGPDFVAAELLGRPTATSVSMNLVPTRALEVYVEYGPSAGSYGAQTGPATVAPDEPFVTRIDGLSPDAAYHYRLRWRSPGDGDYTAGPDRAFHTQRAPGQAFRFTVQADSHMDENSSVEQYHRTLDNVLADQPDFHVDLGDTFMCEKHVEPLSATSPPASDEPSVIGRYRYERDHFGLVSHSVPLFLVNGNHEGELGYVFKGGGENVATWATRARLRYYLNPTPDDFYQGDTADTPGLGQRAAWYAFTWGDALFVALDPFWNTTMKTNKDGWAITLGKTQYDWLAQTLASSKAAYKFVFLHNLVGGLDGQMRGGVEAAPFFEWGGANLDTSEGFSSKRPGWSKPIHQLLVEHKVTAVFHGHDHLYAHQSLDGVVYQEVPQPSAKNTKNGAVLANDYHYASGTTLASAGHLRVTVAPTGVTGEYVRSWLPSAENGQQKNGDIAHSWQVAP